jgi:methionyl aminopeptidase
MFRITETGVEILTRPPVSSSKNKKKKKKNTAAANGNATGTSTPEVGTPTTEAAAGVNSLDIVE